MAIMIYVIIAEDLSGKEPRILVAAQTEEAQAKFWHEHNCLPIGNKDMRESLKVIVRQYWLDRQRDAANDPQSELISDAEVERLTEAYKHVYWQTVKLI